MRIIIPKYEIIEQVYNSPIEDMMKHIEICGRTCYKSEDKITDESYKKFVKMLTDSEHGAMLEHGTVYLTIPIGTPVDDIQYTWKTDIVSFFSSNKYSVVKKKVVNEIVDVEIKGYGMKTQASATFYYITTNWRVICEHESFSILKYMGQWKSVATSLKDSVLQWMVEPTDEHEKRYTVRFTYHLGVARDINRHRVQSVGEESTRYCNYSKDKFGGTLNMIEPVFLTDGEKEILNNPNDHLDFKEMCKHISGGLDESTFAAIDYFIFALEACSYAYLKLTQVFGWTPQKASLILPLDTKTTSVHTAFAKDWSHFFNLRALGTTGAPRPSAKELAWPLMEEFLKRGWITLDMINSQKYYEIKSKYPNIEDYIKL